MLRAPGDTEYSRRGLQVPSTWGPSDNPGCFRGPHYAGALRALGHSHVFMRQVLAVLTVT